MDGDEEDVRQAALLNRLIANYELLKDQVKLGGDHSGNDTEINWNGVSSQLSEKLGLAASEGDACLVCLEAIGATEATWSCRSCFELYHLPCIQKWSLQALQAAEYREVDQGIWHCPKCRREYSEKERPVHYKCFCGKVRDPPSDPWTAPHSCGETCGQTLALCQHTCLLLCHPGACPPCPKVVRSRCFCGNRGPEARRCGKQGWSCGGICDHQLQCGRHRCVDYCHKGDCAVCEKQSDRPCRCGRLSRVVPCLQGEWSCEEICGKALSCGNHKCQLVCHTGECPPCVRPGSNTCPCGKQIYNVSGCRDDLPCCGDTCAKLLDCGIHECIEQCHRGSCPPCNQELLKTCRCGARQKTMQCNKQFLCDTKCRKMKQCKRHACNKKCCDGNCPPCEQTCNRPLNCGRHKCTSPCHQGPCYPCPEIGEVTCACGGTKIRVPCGRQRKTNPPRCRLLCEKKPDCHHERRDPHKCHFNDCPPCQQMCLIEHKDCHHQCPESCHTAVLIDVNAPKKDFKMTTPLDRPTPKFELRRLPCPPCRQLVAVECRGHHEAGQFACCEQRPYSCGRECGRPLVCGNHKCKKQCHEVPKIPPTALSADCDECASMCTLPRPTGCPHICPMACHAPPCPPCRQMIRQTCHCSLNAIYVPCREWMTLSENDRNARLSCGNSCPKLISCGHQCQLTCHTGQCSPRSVCKKRINVRCKCGRLSEKRVCGNTKANESIECTKECVATPERPATAEKAQVQEANDDDPLAYQNVGSRRNRKNKKDRRLDAEDSSGLKAWLVTNKLIVIAVGGVFVAAAVWWFLS